MTGVAKTFSSSVAYAMCEREDSPVVVLDAVEVVRERMDEASDDREIAP